MNGQHQNEPSYFKRILKKKWMIFPTMAIGVAGLIIALSTKQPPKQKPAVDQSVHVSAFRAKSIELTPNAIGYGRVKPSKIWQAVAEVSGRIIWMHPQLEQGSRLEAGTRLLKIDPLDYELRVSQAKAQVQSAKGELQSLKLREKNLNQSLQIEAKQLALNESELKRKQGMLARGLISQSLVDQEAIQYFAQMQKQQNIANSVNLIPAENAVLEAKLNSAIAALQEAERQLARTEILLPFDGRIATVNIKADGFVNLNQIITTVHGNQKMEINAQFSSDQIQPLLNPAIPQAINESTSNPQLALIDKLVEANLRANIYFRTNAIASPIIWPGRVARLSESVDSKAQTIGLIIEVDQSTSSDTSNRQPIKLPAAPLLNDMYTEVRVYGQATPTILIPGAAVQLGQGKPIIYLIDDQNRLQKREINIDFSYQQWRGVQQGINEGELIIISPLSLAIEGMPLTYQIDDDIVQAMQLAARQSGER